MRSVDIARRFLVAAGLCGMLAGMAAADEDGESAYPKVNPLSGQPAAIESGRQLYFTWCVQCHGSKADGVAPRFGKYAKDLRRWWGGYPKFVVTVLNGRPKQRMPPWGGVLDEEQIAQIGAYLETLAMEGAQWK